MPTIHIIVKGEVQGVFYRVNTQKVARRENLNGWVRNRENGDVEIVASGDDEGLRKFVDWCWQGPDKATVEKMHVERIEDKYFKGFEIKRD